MAKNLIIYYSRRGENYVNGVIVSLEKGNTERAAEYIRQAVGGDLFEVDTVKPYAPSYKGCIEQAKDELEADARPALKNYLTDISAYEHIFVCGPCWWGTFPMAVFSLVEKLKWDGKKVAVLMTHEGSGLANSERDLQKICRGAVFGAGLAVKGADVEKEREHIAAWAKSVM